jgi:hypothetical protein
MDRGATLAIAFSALLVATGCSSLTVDVDRDSTIAIPPGSTWAWGPPPTPNRPDELDPRVNNSIIHGRIQRAIEAVLEQKGYRRADPATADFLAEYRVGVKDARQVVTQAVPTGPSYWGGWAWGYYGPPPLVTSQEISYTEGALVVDIQQRSTGKLALRAIGRDTDITQADLSDEGIRKTVTKMLSGLP